MTDLDATLSASTDATGPTNTVGPVVRSVPDLGNANESELLLDIAESLRHICDHADAAEAHSLNAFAAVANLIKNNKRLQKLFG